MLSGATMFAKPVDQKKLYPNFLRNLCRKLAQGSWTLGAESHVRRFRSGFVAAGGRERRGDPYRDFPLSVTCY